MRVYLCSFYLNLIFHITYMGYKKALIRFLGDIHRFIRIKMFKVSEYQWQLAVLTSEICKICCS